jgi:hypothetical protein
LHNQLRELARREGTSINQFISSAVAEKLSALLTEEYLESRAKRGTRRKFQAVLRSVPDVEPDPGDQLPAPSRSRANRGAKPKQS